MKRCPQCKRVEPDDTLTFCRTDGTPLARVSGAASEDAGTLRLSPPGADTSETRILPTGEGLTRPTEPTNVLDGRQPSPATRELAKPKSRRAILIAVAAVAAVALAASAYLYLTRGRGAAVKNSVAVLPFENAGGDPDMEYLSDGITESLINSLSQLPNLAVKARSTVFRYKGKEADPQKVGSELNVQAVLSGRVVQRGDDLTLSLELVDVKTGDQLWGGRYGRKVTDLVALQGELARDVADKLRVRLSGADEQKLAKSYTENAEAYRLYLKGRYHWNRRTRRDQDKAVEYFNQAITVDPDYALAYAGLADAYPFTTLGTWQERNAKAREAAVKAVSLDDSLAEAHTALAQVLAWYDWRFADAERELRRAIELNPNYADAHYWYGHLLYRLGRWEEASAEFRRALELEPLSLIYNANYGGFLFFSRRYDEAIAHLKKTLELDENFIATHGQLMQAYQLKGNYAEAVKERAREREINGDYETATKMRESFAKGGWEGFLRYMTEEQPAPNIYLVATCHAALGEKDKAFAALNESYEKRELQMTLLKVDPRLDPLRSDQRFSELLRKVGLPQ